VTADDVVTAADASARMDACHQMLLGLAGRLPDDLMTRCREQLAQGEAGEVARAVAFCVLSQHLPLASTGAALLAALLAEAGGDASALAEVEIDDTDPVIWYFTDVPPRAGDTGAGQHGAQDASAAAPHELDQAVAEALAAEPGAIGCWRAWRVPPDGAPPAPAKPVFVIEVSADTDAAGVAARVQHRLAAGGEVSPQVEVYHRDTDLPLYQRLARGYGELAWAVAEDPGMQLATIFDEVDPQAGPRFSPSHPRLGEREASQVAQYLREGEPVLVTTAQMDDVVDTTREYCVPLNFRTDGLWIWTEASAYYAQEHHLEPDPALLAHIRSNHHTVPDVDSVALHRALAVLQQPGDEEPVWTLGPQYGQPDTPAPYDDDDTPAPYDDDDDDSQAYYDPGGSQAAPGVTDG
jgi:hypothetical protein